jgi:hypothetical protein
MWTRKIRPDAKEIDVRAVLRGPLGRDFHTRLILDTGSPFTILNVSFAETIGLTRKRSEGPSRLLSPTGPDDGYKGRLSLLVCMGGEIRDVRVRCHRLSAEAKVYGVIGLDIIRRGRLVSDMPDGVVEFTWKR